MTINVLCSSARPKGHTGSHSETVRSKAAILINPELHQSALFPLKSFFCPVKFRAVVISFAAYMSHNICCSDITALEETFKMTEQPLKSLN